MSLYRPSELFAFLDSIDARPKKALSQNFLIDQNIIHKLIAHIEPGQEVLEIGPGPGSITEALLNRGAKVTAVEKDNKLSEALTRLGDLTVLNEDILKVDLLSLPTPLHVVANLPFRITTPVLTRLVPLYPHIASLTFIVQKEVAERMAGKAGTKTYSSLSVFMAFYAKTKLMFTISPSCFSPRPKVSAAAVHITPHAPISNREELFFELVRRAFNTRRKQIQTSLRDLYPPEKTRAALEALNLSVTARPEELQPSDFVALLDALVPPEA